MREETQVGGGGRGGRTNNKQIQYETERDIDNCGPRENF